MTYWVGCAKEQVSVEHTIGMNLQGYAIKGQKITKTGTLFSRAFVIAERKDSPLRKRTAIAVVDIWSCTEELKKRVIEKLHELDFGLTQYYDTTNVQVCGTHTHNAPAGISKYALYNFSSGGFSEMMTNAYATAIAQSILKAHRSMQDCHIHVFRTKVPNCGANRSQPAYDNNPMAERARYETSVDEDMTILSFRAVNRFTCLGTLAWHALHGTDIGQNNTTIDGDNKGRASALLESDRIPVAAFANANAGDVSGNVAYGSLPPTDPSRADAHAKLLAQAVTDQVFDPAKSRETLMGSIWTSLKMVDMSEVTITGTDKRTFPATMGLSSFAGSTEDSVPPFPANLLREGIRRGEASDVELGIQALIASGGSQNDINEELLRFIAPEYRWIAAAPFLHPVTAIPGAIAALGLEFLQLLEGGLGAKSIHDLTESQREGHAPKPITMNVSNIVPQELPLQIIVIGNLAILGVPAELTTMAGRRLRERLMLVMSEAPQAREHFNKPDTVITAGYANAYSQYVSTKEEYDMQHYEGSSTLFGPHTLEAYIQEFTKMVLAPA